ncbi:MAG TPA: hypothetical protein VMB34_13730, partial [Acetobacteraceae bacterium]|nr:hypothetical protein [Acetobacteraceae bacterium]
LDFTANRWVERPSQASPRVTAGCESPLQIGVAGIGEFRPGEITTFRAATVLNLWGRTLS